MVEITLNDRTTPLHTRRDDISLILTQNNSAQDIVIDDALGADLSVFRITGFAPEELRGARFVNLLPQRIRESVEEYVEYDLTGTDIHDVLKRTRNFAIIRKDGAVVPLSMRVQHGVMGAHPQIILVMGMSDAETNACIRELVELKATESKDVVAGITDAASFQNQARLVEEHIGKGNIVASVVVLQIDRADMLEAELGDAEYTKLVQQISQRLRRSFRSSDMLGYIGNGWYSAVLLKADKEQVRIPLTRLRNGFAGQPVRVAGSSQPVTFSIGYNEIEKGDDIEAALTNARGILQHGGSDTDRLVEI